MDGRTGKGMMTEQGQSRGWWRDKQGASDGEEQVMKEGKGMMTTKLPERD